MPRHRPRIARRTLALALAGLLGAACVDRETVQPPPDGLGLYERSVGGLACADCHGVRPGGAANPDWRLPGSSLSGVSTRPSLWGGRFSGAGAVENATLFCAAKFQYRMLGETLGDSDGEHDFAGVPLEPSSRLALTQYVSAFAGSADAVPLDRIDDVDAMFDLDGDPDRGELVWAASCAVCHGSEAEGGLGPPLRGNDAPDPFDLAEYVRRAAPVAVKHEWMPWFGPEDLSTQDLADLAARYAE